MDDNEEQFEKSKSQVKRELHALQDLGRELLRISPKYLQQVPMSEEIRRAIVEARHLKMAALQRQVKHIGKLMRAEDEAAIRAALVTVQQPHTAEVNTFHEVETWRDGLLAGDDGLLEELCARFANLDRQHLRQLVRNAQKEAVLNKAPKSARALFRYLRDLPGSPG